MVVLNFIFQCQNSIGVISENLIHLVTRVKEKNLLQPFMLCSHLMLFNSMASNIDEKNFKLKTALFDVETKPNNPIQYYSLPLDPLTDEDLLILQVEWSKFTEDQAYKQFVKPYLFTDFLNKNDFKALNYLCHIDKQKLDHQFEEALRQVFALTDNIFVRSRYIREVAIGQTKIDYIAPLMTSNCLETALINFDHKSMIKALVSQPLPTQPFEPLIPILQKFVRTLVDCCENISLNNKKQQNKLKLDQQLDFIPIPNTDELFLGYIPGCFPFPYHNNDAYQLIELPYKLYHQHNSNIILVKNKSVILESGIVIKQETTGEIPITNTTSFFYLSKDSDLPFTASPIRLHDVGSPEQHKDMLAEIPQFLQDYIPKSDGIEFISLPVSDIDKDIMELLFLEQIVAQSSNSTNSDEQQIAQDMIEYIKENTKQPITGLIAKLEQQLMQDRKLITEEQQQISKEVIQGSVKGKNNHNRISQNKVKNKKNKNSKTQKNLIVNSKGKPTNFKDFQKKLEQEEQLNKLKEAGNIKYRKMLNIVNKIMKTAINQNLIQSTKGSHITLHSDTGAATLVRKHSGKSKDSSIFKSTAKRFYEKLTSIVDLNF